MTAAALAAVLLLTGLTLSGTTAQALEAREQGAQDAREERFAPGKGFTVATLNLRKGMRVEGMRHDINTLLRNNNTSVIGFQERLFSRKALRASLPGHWSLLMPDGPTGTDDNPIAFDKRRWALVQSWSALLAAKTWRRRSGQTAHDQYGVVAVLKNRRSGHIIRAISFHLPNDLHNRQSGGPNYANRGGVETMWRMSRRIRFIKNDTPKPHQFIAMCDCNVTWNRDTGKMLVKGQITKPLGLETNYSTPGQGPGSGIDYVMGERDADFRIHSYISHTRLVTDHPGVVATFRRLS